MEQPEVETGFYQLEEVGEAKTEDAPKQTQTTVTLQVAAAVPNRALLLRHLIQGVLFR
jgi:hypothetical protein